MKYDSIFPVLENLHEDFIPIVIPIFNTVSYTKSMVNQLDYLGLKENIIVCDNGSQYPPMIEYLEEISSSHNVVLWNKNLGPRIYIENKKICKAFPKHFVITDPDLIINPEIPKNFLRKMKRILDMYPVSKVGFAIDIDTPEERSRFFNPDQIDFWERRYWDTKLELYPEKDDLYVSPIDTTFCMYDRDKFIEELPRTHAKMSVNTSSIRIAGRFTCRHMGWWENQPLEKEEYEFYKNTHTWSSTENEKKRLGY